MTFVTIPLRLEALESQEALSGKIADAISGMQEIRKVMQGLGKDAEAAAIQDCLAKAPQLILDLTPVDLIWMQFWPSPETSVYCPGRSVRPSLQEAPPYSCDFDSWMHYSRGNHDSKGPRS